MFSNPVRAGSVLTISIAQAEVAMAAIQLLDASGELIESIEQDPWDYATVINIRIPMNAMGIYYIRMVDARGRKLTAQKIVVE